MQEQSNMEWVVTERTNSQGKKYYVRTLAPAVTTISDPKPAASRTIRVQPLPGPREVDIAESLLDRLQTPVRVLLVLTLGYSVLGFLVIIESLLLKTADLLLGSFLLTTFVSALPFEAGYLALTMKGFFDKRHRETVRGEVLR